MRDRGSKFLTGRLLDIGCGTKTKKLLVGEYVDEYVGLDHVDSQHDQSQVDMFGPAYEIPDEQNSFDCLLSTAVLEHLEEPQRALDEAYRVCKPGGHAIYTAPLVWHLHEEPRDFFRYTRHGLRHLFETAGFTIIEITPMAGFWVTFGTEFGYYLQRFSRGIFKPFVKSVVLINNLIYPRIDRWVFKDERFAWAYLVVVRKPIDRL